MDRGRHGDDGPDDVVAAEDRERIDLPPQGGGSSPDAPRAEDGRTAVDGPPADGDGDGRPAVWLDDIRARAPWLLEPGGALEWLAAASRGPDIVPHGAAPSAPAWSAVETAERREPAVLEPANASEPLHRLRGIEPVRPVASTDATPPSVALDAATSDEGPTLRADVPYPSTTEPPAAPPEDDRDLRTPASRAPGTTEPPPPAAETPSTPAAPDPLTPDTAPTLDAHPPAERWLDADPRRPAIHRSSATWPSPSARPAASSPVWPPRPHPEGTGLPHTRPFPAPAAPARPAPPFVPGWPASAAHPSPPPAPTWADDRTGWQTTPFSTAQIVDDGALPSWPSLFEDDDEDDDGPDWTALERRLERNDRLDREQRRR